MNEYFLHKNRVNQKKLTGKNTVRNEYITIRTDSNDVIQGGGGSSARNSRIVTGTTSWIADDNNSTVLIDNQTAGVIFYNLPASPSTSDIVTIFVEDTNTQVVTINGNGNTINGSSTYDFTTNKTGATFEFFAGYGWRIVSVA